MRIVRPERVHDCPEATASPPSTRSPRLGAQARQDAMLVGPFAHAHLRATSGAGAEKISLLRLSVFRLRRGGPEVVPHQSS